MAYYRCRHCEWEATYVRRFVKIEATVDYELHGNGGDNCTALGCCVGADGDHSIPDYDEVLDDCHVHWSCTNCGAEDTRLDRLVEWYEDEPDTDEDSDYSHDDTTTTQGRIAARRRAKGLS